MATIPIPLKSGAYQAQSLIANAQRSINLYVEANPAETEPTMPTAHYPRPGLGLLNAPPAPGRGRCLYTTTNGNLYAVIDQAVYYIDPNWQFTQLGAMLVPGATPASISDNGITAVVVDGSPNGSTITLATNAFANIGDPNFLGADRVDFIDTFLVFNVPGTNQWYSTTSGVVTPFNALFLGIKTAWPDAIQSIITTEREVFLLGRYKSEPWYNAGTVPFPFQLLPGVIIEQGCAAKYSPAKMDINFYWLSQSPEGDRMVMRCNNQNVAQRISTHAIEAEFKRYARVDDAIGSVYQIIGHSFYRLHFPTADTTWVFDEATKQWHQDVWIDANGAFHRARDTFNAFAYGKNVGLDWANGNLYQVDPETSTDAAQPIVCIRSFPHIVKDLKELSMSAFVADMETGTIPNTGDGGTLSPWSAGFSSGFGPLTPVAQPQIGARLSKDGGHTFGNFRLKDLAAAGHYRTMKRWRSWGIGRDNVFEVAWSAPMKTALLGAYIDPLASSS